MCLVCEVSVDWVTHCPLHFLCNLAVNDWICIVTKKVVTAMGDQEYGIHTKIDTRQTKDLISCAQRSDLLWKKVRSQSAKNLFSCIDLG